MEKLYLDLSIVLFFLAALVIVSQTRSQISQKKEVSFNLISAGICAFSLLSTISMIQNQLVTLVTISISATAAVEFIQLMLLISGLVFVTSGVSKLLPAMGLRAERDDSNILQIGQLKRLGAFISTPSSFDDFMRESLDIFADNIRITAGAVYAVAKTKDLAKLMAAYGTLKNSSGISEKFIVNPRWMESLRQTEFTAADVSFSKIHPNASGYCYCFPMISSNGRTFLYLIWAKEKYQAESLDPYILQRLTDSLNARLATERLFLHNDFNKMFGDFAQSLREKIVSQQSVNEMLITLKNDLLTHMPLDYISICMKNPDGTGRRISIGLSGTILNETDVTFGPHNSYLNQVMEFHRAVNYTNIDGEREVSFPELLSVSRIKSLMAIPLQSASGTKGIFTIGAEAAAAYRRVDLEILNRVTSSFEIILNELALEKRTEAIQYRVKLLKEFAKAIAGTASESNMYERAAGIISKALGCSIVRISTIDREEKFLHSKLLINDSAFQVRTPEQGHLILSLLKWHRTVHQNGNTVVVNCMPGKLSMPDIETMQVFSAGVKCAVIVPINVNNRVLGMISLADDKVLANTSFTDDNIEFVETIGSIMAVTLDSPIRSQEARADFATPAKEEIIHAGQSRGMRSQLKSSLTSIIGSLDMIKSGGANDEIKKDRFLEIIDKSARKMTEYFSE